MLQEEKRSRAVWYRRYKAPEEYEVLNDTICREVLDRILSFLVASIKPRRMTLHGTSWTWAHQLPLPVKLVKRRFDCNTQEHRDVVRRITKSTQHPFSASINHCHPTFNDMDIPATAVKTVDFWFFNQLPMSESFWIDVISQALVNPNVRHVAAVICNRYMNNLQEHVTKIEKMTQQGCRPVLGEPPVSAEDVASFKVFALRGISKPTIIDMICLYRILQLPPLEASMHAGDAAVNLPPLTSRSFSLVSCADWFVFDSV